MKKKIVCFLTLSLTGFFSTLAASKDSWNEVIIELSPINILASSTYLSITDLIQRYDVSDGLITNKNNQGYYITKYGKANIDNLKLTFSDDKETILTHPLDNEKELKITYYYKIVDLSDKPIETDNDVFKIWAKKNNKTNTIFFPKGSKCIFLEGQNINYDALKVNFSKDFESSSSLNEIKQEEKGRSNLIDLKQGVWSEYEWAAFQFKGYKGKPYFSSNLSFKNKVYISEFYQKGNNPEFYPGCSAYNQIAVGTVLQNAKKLSQKNNSGGFFDSIFGVGK